MRLDEWQKYIDSQFLDDTPPPAAAPAASAVSSAAQVPAAPADLPAEAVPIADAAISRTEKADADQLAGLAPVCADTTSERVPDAATQPPSSREHAAPAVQTESGQEQNTHVSAPDSVAANPAPAAALPVSASLSDEATAFPEPALSVTHSVFTLVVTPPPPAPPSSAQPSSARPPRIELLTPLPDAPDAPTSPAPEIVNKTRRRSQGRPAIPPGQQSPDDAVLPFTKPIAPAFEALSDTSPAGLFQPLSDLGADIPEFARYLPSTHAAAPAPEPTLPPDTVPTPLAATEPELPSDASRAMPDPARRLPRIRARHPRSAHSPHGSADRSPAELWTAMPRHMQTLLALERIEDKNEIAQSSYKRPFQEKRHELIERLLDPVLSLEDTARLLNVCPTTVRRYTNKGILTYYRKPTSRGGGSPDSEAGAEKETRQRRFRLSDILAFLETQQPAVSAERHAARRKRTQAVSLPDSAAHSARDGSPAAHSHSQTEPTSPEAAPNA